MNADWALKAWMQSDLPYDVSTHKDNCAAPFAVLWISAQFAEMLDCIAGGVP